MSRYAEATAQQKSKIRCRIIFGEATKYIRHPMEGIESTIKRKRTKQMPNCINPINTIEMRRYGAAAAKAEKITEISSSPGHSSLLLNVETTTQSGKHTTKSCEGNRINNTTIQEKQQQTTYQSNNGGMTACSTKATKKVFM